MPGEDEVPAVHVVAIDGQTEPGHDLDHAVEHLGAGDGVVQLGVADVFPVGRGEHGHDHGHRPVAVQEAHYHADPPDQNKPGTKMMMMMMMMMIP